MPIDWTRGYSCEWRVMRVDPDTWADAGTVGGFDSATVTRELDGTMERASLTLAATGTDRLPESWYRLVMTAIQGGSTERADVCTVWCNATEDRLAHGMVEREVTGRSVLWPVSAAVMPIGSYAPAGTDGARWAAQQISSRTPAPVTVAGGFTLDSHVVFDQGTSALDAVWQVLDAGGFTIMLDGYGNVTIAPMPTEPSLVLDAANARLLQPEATAALDWSEVPNRYVAVVGGRTAEAVNDDPASVTSTVARGFVVDADNTPDTSPVMVGGETLGSYCARRLAELSVVRDEHTYSREWWPGVFPGSLVRGSLGSVGIEGDLRVTAQQLTCARGIVVEETAGREVSAWPA